MSTADPRPLLRALFDHAVASAQPEHCLPPHLAELRQGHTGRTVVIGAGKAAAAMAAAVERHWSGPLAGVVVTRYGHGAGIATRSIDVLEAAHPVPDAAGVAAAARMLAAVRGLREDDLVLCLLSGGGSALLTLPAPGIALADKQAVSRALLASGAPISHINLIRKQLSQVKGGRLAEACLPARVATLIISDVAGDDPALVASGPTLPDTGTPAEALALLRRYGVDAPPAVIEYLSRPWTPAAPDPRLARNSWRIVASAATALEAAAAHARALGLAAHVWSDRIEGEAREAALLHAAQARALAAQGPCVLLSGGETTVTLEQGLKAGRGGRNGEFLLALALALDGDPRFHALACDTDGIDGSEDNAGALIGPDTLARSRRLGLDARALLAAHDSYGYFEALGDLVRTGPTRTNVNDFRAILIA